MKKNIFTYDVFQKVVKSFVKESYEDGSHEMGEDSFQLSDADKDEIVKGYLKALVFTSDEEISSRHRDLTRDYATLDEFEDAFLKSAFYGAYDTVEKFIKEVDSDAMDEIRREVESEDITYEEFGSMVLYALNGAGAGFKAHSFEHEDVFYAVAKEMAEVQLLMGEDGTLEINKIYYKNLNR